MSRGIRIGLNVIPYDPFWVEVCEAANSYAQQLHAELIPIHANNYFVDFVSKRSSDDEKIALVEELLGQEVDAIIGWDFSEELAFRVLNAGIAIIPQASETIIDHPLYVVRSGLYPAANIVGSYVAEQLGGRGHIMVLGGMNLQQATGDGRSRVAGFREAFASYPEITWQHIPSFWDYERAYSRFYDALQEIEAPIAAIIGLSDTLAIAGRDAANALGRLEPQTLTAGINGDPLALAAIASGSLTATVETSATDLGQQLIELAHRAASGLPLPERYNFTRIRLVTKENVAEVALQKLTDIAEIPSKLIGATHQTEQQQLTQLATNLEISRQIGSILDRWALSQQIVHLICASYQFDHGQIFLWSEGDQRLTLEESETDPQNRLSLSIDEAGPLGLAVQRDELIFIPDAKRSSRFPSDPRWPYTHSRVILPIRQGNQLIGILDLHSDKPAKQTHQELIGLQSLAAQLGIAIRNAGLFEDVSHARDRAEQADKVKSAFLASMSHELRTPLNAIINFSKFLLKGIPGPVNEEQQQLISSIASSGQHLLNLINDVLDMSKIEAGSLSLYVEDGIDMNEVVELAIQYTSPLLKEKPVALYKDLPGTLPLITGDRKRLLQIVLNILSNACKFTEEGYVRISAKAEAGHVFVAVEDTGPGIASEDFESVFSPFKQTASGIRQSGGTGLGMPICKNLTEIHNGRIWFESEVGKGTTFFVKIPIQTAEELERVYHYA